MHDLASICLYRLLSRAASAVSQGVQILWRALRMRVSQEEEQVNPMACGVTKTFPGTAVVVTCTNAGTSAHAGPHTGPVTFAAYGRNWTSQTVTWYAADVTPGKTKAAVLGQDDFV